MSQISDFSLIDQGNIISFLQHPLIIRESSMLPFIYVVALYGYEISKQHLMTLTSVSMSFEVADSFNAIDSLDTAFTSQLAQDQVALPDALIFCHSGLRFLVGHNGLMDEAAAIKVLWMN